MRIQREKHCLDRYNRSIVHTIMSNYELYHCLYKKPTGDALLATYEGEFSGISGKFLFAATHLTKALAYAFSYHDREVMGNGEIEGTDNEFVVLRASKNPLEKERHIIVLSFNKDGFIPLEEGSRQSVLPTNLPFEKTTRVLETTHYQDLMQKGLQIFVFNDSKYPDSMNHGIFKYTDKFPTMESGFAHLLNTGYLRWINREENIGICPTLKIKIQAEEIPAFLNDPYPT